MAIRQTHTVARLDISPEAFKEIADKLREAGYDHAFMPGGEIDMSGICVANEGFKTTHHHIKTDGDYRERLRGLHEPTLDPMVAYQAKSGEIWFRKADQFDDPKRFEKL